MTHLDEGEYYNFDGDVVDARNEMIQRLKSDLYDYRYREMSENTAREKNPAVKEAWDKYQTLLALTKVEQ